MIQIIAGLFVIALRFAVGGVAIYSMLTLNITHFLLAAIAAAMLLDEK